MTAPLRRRLRLARRGVWYVLAIGLVLMALGAGIVSQLLPLAERHPGRIAAWLGERAGRPVAFDALSTAWTRRGPLLRLDGLRIGEGGDAVRIGEAEILVAQYAGLLPGRSFTELRLRGLQLTLERDAESRWGVRGLPGQSAAGGDPLSALEGLGELQVIGGRLSIHAPALGIDATVPRADLRLRVDGQRVRAAARAWMRADAAPVDVALELDRRSGDGRAHAAAEPMALSAWSPLLRYAGVSVEDGEGRLQVWAGLEGHRVSALTVEATLAALSLRGAPLAGREAEPALRFPRLDVRARMQSDAQGWRIDAERLRIDGDGGEQRLDGLLLAGGARRAFQAARIDAGPLLSLLALSDRLDDPLRTWLLAAAPAARLHDVRIAGDAHGRALASARIEGLRFASVGDTPGIAGLSGSLEGDADGFAFAFDPAATLRFDWPSGFGPPHDVALQGTLAGWRDGAGIRVETPALRVAGDGYGMRARGGLWFQGDGTRPAIDLVADIDEAEVPVARRFWVRHLMPEAAVEWLDGALLAGTVRNGRAVIAGDLDDWPFSTLEDNQHKGLFHAEADLVDAQVRFQPDWPAAEHIDARVAFVNDGFTVSGRAALAGVRVDTLDAALPHYGQAELAVRARASTGAAELLALLRGSPLHAEHGETLDSIAASGPAAAAFALDLPMHGGRGHRIDGTVELRGARLADPRWDVAFEDVRGKARFDQHGFDSGELSVVQEGRPGVLTLRAGDGHVRDRAHALEAGLDASLDAARLLARAPEMAWLQPYVAGTSRWHVQVMLPAAAASAARQAQPARLRLRSDLVGTALALPRPMDKPADASLPTTVETTLPLDGDEIAVAFGQRLALRARTAQGRTGVRVTLGAGRVHEPPPAEGLLVSGRTGALDAIEWATFTTGGGDEGLPLRGLDVVAGQLLLPGGRFADTRVMAVPAEGGTRVSFDGPAIAGALRLPDSAGATVSGRFQRIHWQVPPAAPAPAGAAASPPVPSSSAASPPSPPEEAFDPARIPPLALDVDDLRVGELALGTTLLRTQPTADGLRIERLQMQAPKQRIAVGGEWSGRGDGAATRLEVEIDSQDFGALLAGLGLGRQVLGGTGELRFRAGWPGSPAAFEVGALEGALDALIKDGRLAEVEPGAGRLLGLLSVAQLPRRLMLDFSDFFASGFAFNRIGGQVTFGDGEARSDGIVIDGPAAEIRIVGRSDLRAQVHDQTIEVFPRTGNLLPAVGAIAGGPVGAAFGAVANAVLRKPLGEMNARTYRVSGPWKDPKVDVAEHGAARPPPAAPAQDADPR